MLNTELEEESEEEASEEEEGSEEEEETSSDNEDALENLRKRYVKVLPVYTIVYGSIL